MNKNNFAIIMAGGIGSRFWPWSKTNNPKQFLDILGTGKSLIEQTYDRILKICPQENIFIITNKSYKEKIKTLIKDIPDENILVEPFRRNTAPCIAYGAFKIKKLNPNARILVAPSDHLIQKEVEFSKIVEDGFDLSEETNGLLTIGIIPHWPETGYGYIHADKCNTIKKTDLYEFFKVKKFVEKPPLEVAIELYLSKQYYWNAGIFIWSVSSIIEAFKNYMPEIFSLFTESEEYLNTDKEYEKITEIYEKSPNISIDYAVMEKANNVYVLTADIGWSDIGTWGALYELSKKDSENNFPDNQNVLFYDTKNCYVHLPEGKIAVICGLDDFIIVDNDKELLICPKNREQEIRNFVNDVEKRFGNEHI